MAREKKKITTKKSAKKTKSSASLKTKITKKASKKSIKLEKAEKKNPKFYDQLKLNESYVSLVLGAVVVVAISGIVFAYIFGTRNEVKNQRVLNSVITPSPTPAGDEYIMQEGESLWDLAVRFYGDGFAYKRIVEANKNVITNPDYVPPGTKIIIPLP